MFGLVGEDPSARCILAPAFKHFHFGGIEATCASDRVQPPFDPAMMTAMLLYGYCNGLHSSRRIAKASLLCPESSKFARGQTQSLPACPCNGTSLGDPWPELNQTARYREFRVHMAVSRSPRITAGAEASPKPT